MNAVVKALSLPYWKVAVLVLAIAYVIKPLFCKIRLYILGNKLPGPKGWPIIGNCLEFTKPNLDILDKIWKYNQEYGLVRLWLGPQLNVFICTAEDAQIYYSSPTLLDRSEHFEFVKPLIGNGLLTANGARWKKSKKLMEPSLRYSSLRSFVPHFQAKTDVLIGLLEAKVGKPTFLAYDYFKNCTFDIITKTMCDVELNPQMETVDILEHVDILMMYIPPRIHSIWHQSDFLYKFSKIGKDFFRRTALVKEYVDNRIRIEKESIKENKKTFKGNGDDDDDLKQKSFMKRLIEQEEWNDDEIRDHITTMVATGFESTASQVSFIIALLGIHQDVQERLYEEISSAVEDGLHDKELERLEYLDKVIKETMRLFPIGTIPFRRASEDMRFGEHLVPKGAAIGINIFAIHRNPKYYDNPSAFNPENFSKEKVAKRHPFAFVPFGMGVRKCIGEKFAWMTLRIIIAKIVLNYNVECDLKLEDIRIRLDVALKMVNKCPIRLTRRKATSEK